MTTRSPSPRDELDTLVVAENDRKSAQEADEKDEVLIEDAAATVEAVLDVVSLIPPGRVATYGDIAELVRTGPRRVGTIMAQVGDQVTWWRVTNARGALPPHLVDEAARRWAAEGTPMAHDRSRCLLRECRADLEALAEAVESA